MRRIDLEYTTIEKMLRESTVIPESDRELWLRNTQEKLVVAGRHAGAPVFWGGIVRKSEKSGEIFLYLEDRSFVGFPAAARELVDLGFSRFRYTQITGSALKASTVNNRFLLWLGFEVLQECTGPDGLEYIQYHRRLEHGSNNCRTKR